MITIIVASRIIIRHGQLPRKVLAELCKLATHPDPTSPSQWCYSYERNSVYIGFWRGLLHPILKCLQQHKLDWELQDKRLTLPFVEMANNIVLRDYQISAVEGLLKNPKGLLRAPTGSGKTTVLLDVVAKLGQPTLILVWQERQQKVWKERVEKHFGWTPDLLGGGSSNERTNKPITVGLVQTVRLQLKHIKDQFGAVVCDEVGRFAAESLRDVVNALPAAVRIGCSDDEHRRDGKEFMLYDTFGPARHKITGEVGQCPVKVVAVATDYKASGGDYHTVIAKLLNNHSRNQFILDLAETEARAGHRVLIWSGRVAHCYLLKEELLKRGLVAGLLIGGTSNKLEANDTENGLATGRIQVGIGTSVAEQSVDIPALDRGIMACGGADDKLLRFRQMRGRLCRVDPKNPEKRSVLYYVWDKRVSNFWGKVENIKRMYPVQVWLQTELEQHLQSQAER